MMHTRAILSTITALICLATPAHTQPCDPQYVGTTSVIESIAISGSTLIEARPRIGLDIFDASDTDNLIKLTQVPFPDAYNMIVDADADTAAVQTSNTTLQLIDITDPSSPSVAAEIVYTQEISFFAIRGTHVAALIDSGGGLSDTLEIHDITDLANPQLLTQTTAKRGRRFQMSSNAVVSGLPDESGLQIHDLTGTVAPTPAATLPGWDEASMQGDTLAVIQQGMIAFYDLTTPASPTQISTFNAGTYSDGFSSLNTFKYVGDYLFVYSGEDMSCVETVHTYDVSDTQSLILVNTYTSGDCEAYADTRINPAQMFPLNGEVVTFTTDLFEYTNLSQSFNAVKLQNSPAWGRTFEHNGYIYGTNNGYLRVALPAPLESLEPIAEIEIEQLLDTFVNIQILGFTNDIALVASGEQSAPWDNFITTVDISDPTQPQIVNRIRFSSRSSTSPILVGNHAYVVDDDEGVLRATEIMPTGQVSPLSETPLLFDGNPRLKHFDARLYVVQSFGFNDTHDFRAFDLTDPLNPTLLFEIDHENNDLDGNFEVIGNRAYFKRVFRDYAVLDFSNPANPIITSNPQLLPDNAQLIGSANNMLYFRTNGVGMTVIDVSHPNVYPLYGPFTFLTANGIDYGGIVNYPFLDSVITERGTNTRYDISSCLPEPCPADLTDDGVLNFFDVSAFLNAFVSKDPAADLNSDGAYNFFDVSLFLNAFNAGCP